MVVTLDMLLFLLKLCASRTICRNRFSNQYNRTKTTNELIVMGLHKQDIKSMITYAMSSFPSMTKQTYLLICVQLIDINCIQSTLRRRSSAEEQCINVSYPSGRI